MAKYLGRFVAWLSRDGRIPVFSLVVAIGVLFVPHVRLWQVALGYVAVAAMVWALVRAHMRVVIDSFDDYTVPAGQPTDVVDAERRGADSAPGDTGTAVLLANRLAELRELYGFVDDPDRTPAPDRAARATVQLDDASNVLKSAVTTESSVSLGPVTLPWGALMGLLGRFSQAPQLSGAIHGDERRLVVTAELTRHRQPYSWRVARTVPNGTTPRQTLESMITQELAFQIFSELTLQKQAMWPATKFWLLALAKMSECQRRPRNRRLLLKDAERHFMSALAEDEQFYLACLNLGIVYRRLALELKHPVEGRSAAERDKAEERAKRYRQAARRVFERAIRLRPDRWEAYHALADVHWAPDDNSGSLEKIPGLCDRALELGPDRAARARILDLKGNAEEAAAKVAEKNGNTPEHARLLRLAVATQRRACRCVLRELRRTRLWQASSAEARRLDTLEKQASQCLVNFAWTSWKEHVSANPKRRTRRDRAAFKRVYAAARLAARLSDLDAEAHQKLADLAWTTNQRKIVVEQLSAATRIAPDDPHYAAQLAAALAPDGGPHAWEACDQAERLIDFGEPDHKDAQEKLLEAYESLEGADEFAKRIAARMPLARELAEANAKSDPVTALEGLLEGCVPYRDWEAARVHEAIGVAILEGSGEAAKRGTDAGAHFAEALEWFEANQPTHRRVAELYSRRAEALALQRARSGDALAAAETAVNLDPLCARYRDVLADAYEAGRDAHNACEAAEQALLLEPDAPQRHYRLGKMRWELAESFADPVMHEAERRRAANDLQQALKLYESDQQAERRTAHWWLAMSYFAMSDFTLVPQHLLFVISSLKPGDGGDTAEELGIRAVAELWLAMTYRKLQNFVEAESHAHEAIGLATGLVDDGAPLDEDLAGLMDDHRWRLGLVVTLAHLQLAGCHADRTGDLDTARDQLAKAKAALGQLDNDELRDYHTDAKSDYDSEEGRLLLAEGDPEAAIASLERSARADPGEADVYLLLARAHVRVAEDRVEAESAHHVRRARDACRRTREIGGEGHPDTLAAAELERRLKRVEADSSGLPDFTLPLRPRPAAEQRKGQPAAVGSAPWPFPPRDPNRPRRTRTRTPADPTVRERIMRWASRFGGTR